MNLSFLSWQEGKYSDMWFFVHLMSGVVGGTGLLLIHTPEPLAWCIAFILAILWEIYEWKTGIRERIQNKIIDIFVGVGGGAIGYIYVRSFHFSSAILLALFVTEAAALTILAIIGWKYYKRYAS